MQKQRKKRLTAKRKFEVYLATRPDDAPVGEVLRDYGLHLSDLRKIEETVETGAVEALKVRKNGANQPVSAAEYNAVRQELERKTKVLADVTVEYTLLKKKDGLD